VNEIDAVTKEIYRTVSMIYVKGDEISINSHFTDLADTKQLPHAGPEEPDPHQLCNIEPKTHSKR